MKPKSISVPFDQFDTVTALIEEHEDTASEDVFAQVVTDDRNETVVGFAEINRFAAEEDPRAVREV